MKEFEQPGQSSFGTTIQHIETGVIAAKDKFIYLCWQVGTLYPRLGAAFVNWYAGEEIITQAELKWTMGPPPGKTKRDKLKYMEEGHNLDDQIVYIQGLDESYMQDSTDNFVNRS